MLDGDMLTGLKSRENFWIHVDGEILIGHYLLIPCSYHLIYPQFEAVSHDGVNHVCQIGPWKLFYFSGLFWESLSHLWEILRMVKHRLRAQSFKMRHLDSLH